MHGDLKENYIVASDQLALLIINLSNIIKGLDMSCSIMHVESKAIILIHTQSKSIVVNPRKRERERIQLSRPSNIVTV